MTEIREALTSVFAAARRSKIAADPRLGKNAAMVWLPADDVLTVCRLAEKALEGEEDA